MRFFSLAFRFRITGFQVQPTESFSKAGISPHIPICPTTPQDCTHGGHYKLPYSQAWRQWWQHTLVTHKGATQSLDNGQPHLVQHLLQGSSQLLCTPACVKVYCGAVCCIYISCLMLTESLPCFVYTLPPLRCLPRYWVFTT